MRECEKRYFMSAELMVLKIEGLRRLTQLAVHPGKAVGNIAAIYNTIIN